MINKNTGALPSQILEKMIEDGNIQNAQRDNISPSSLDLTVSEEVYRVEGVFLPKQTEAVRDVLNEMEIFPFNFIINMCFRKIIRNCKKTYNNNY